MNRHPGGGNGQSIPRDRSGYFSQSNRSRRAADGRLFVGGSNADRHIRAARQPTGSPAFPLPPVFRRSGPRLPVGAERPARRVVVGIRALRAGMTQGSSIR